MKIGITGYEVICNLGVGIEEVYRNAVCGVSDRFEVVNDIIQNKTVRVGKVDVELPSIDDDVYNTRCNRLILKCLSSLGIERVITKYGADNVAVVVATTNTGVEDYENSEIVDHFEIGNPAEFIKEHFGLNNFYTSVSTACSSGVKAFSIARDVLNSGIADCAIVCGVDSLTKLPVFGFDSLGVLSSNPTNPFSQNREGINIGEGVAGFIIEKGEDFSIDIWGIGETTDNYHATCPDPEGAESVSAVNLALKDAGIQPDEIDYINLHGTGTVSNDLMEAKTIYSVFGDKVLCSSTKPLTGHCLGAAAAVEIGLCCKLIEKGDTKLYPHIYDNCYDESLPKISLVKDEYKRVRTCLCTSFGFGGTNTAIVLGGRND